MLKEFVEQVARMALDGAAADLKEIPGQPRSLLLVQGGTREILKMEPPLVAVELTALTSFMEYLAPVKEIAHVFVSPEGLTALLDAKDRRETASMSLTKTDVWEKLSGLTKWRGFRPDQVCRFLREIDAPVGVVGPVSKIDFKRMNAAVAENKHGTQSLGRAVEAKVQNAENIPEVFPVETSIFIEDGCSRTVTVTVELFLACEEEQIQLRVSPDRLAKGMAEVLEDIGEAIEAQTDLAGIRVFMGSP